MSNNVLQQDMQQYYSSQYPSQSQYLQQQQQSVYGGMQQVGIFLQPEHYDFYGGFVRQWKQHETKEGVPYWYDIETGASTWDNPIFILTVMIENSVPNTSMFVPQSWSGIQNTPLIKVMLKTEKEFFIHRYARRVMWTNPIIEASHHAPQDIIKNERKKEEEKNEEEIIKGVEIAKDNNFNEIGVSLDPADYLDDDDEEADNSDEDNQEDESQSENEEEEKRDTKQEEHVIDDVDFLEEKYGNEFEIFKQMLSEKGVNSLSGWDKELPKILYDSRYTILPLEYRKLAFELYTKSHLRESRKEQLAKKKEVNIEYRRMLEEYLLQGKLAITSDYHTFQALAKSDKRYMDMLQHDKNKIYPEFVMYMKTRREKRIIKCLNWLEKGIYRDQFKKLLSEIEESKYNEDTEWKQFKKYIKDDIRYKQIGSVTEKKTLFMEHLKNVITDREQTTKRETELKRKRELDEIESDIKRRRLKNEKVTEEFKSLLLEKIKLADYTWHEAKKLLEKEDRFNNPELDIKQKEDIFRSFIKDLYNKRRNGFNDLLEENENKFTVKSSWKEVEKLLLKDHRYHAMPKNDRHRLFTNFQKHTIDKMKRDLEDMLEASLYILNSKIKPNTSEEEEIEEFNKIVAELSQDVRFRNMELIIEERDRILRRFIRKIKRGKEE